MLSTREVAARLGAHPRTVQLWCEAGRLPGAQMVGRTWVIPEASLTAFERPRIGWEPGRPRGPRATSRA